MFHYCAYWRTWSRILGTVNERTVEVDLTPIPNCYDSTWEDVAKVRIRAHVTAPGRGDKHTAILPPDVVSQVFDKIGEAQTEFLMYGDILPLIDWDKYAKENNGGAFLPNVLKG